MFSVVFASVLDTCFKCFICLLLYVATIASDYLLKVDRVLHMGCAWEAAGGVGDVQGSMGDVRSGTGTLLVARSQAQRVRRSLVSCAVR